MHRDDDLAQPFLLVPWRLDRLYGGFSVIDSGAEDAVGHSLDCYLLWLDDRAPAED